MSKLRNLTILLVSLTIISSCQTEVVSEPAPDVSHLTSNVKIHRFDKDMYAVSADNVEQSLPALLDKYPAFTKIFFEHILPLAPRKEGESLISNYKAFLQEEGVDKLADTIQLLFTDMSDIQQSYDQANKYYQHYFDGSTLPDLYTYYSGFAMQRFLFGDTLDRDAVGVGLDLFIGGDFDYKSIDPSNTNFSAYLTRSFDKNHLVKKALDLKVEEIVGQPDGIRLIDQMVNAGKKLYILDKLLPQVSDTIVMEYTKDQLKWCKENELQMWSFFFEKELFYETNAGIVRKYIDHNPTSQGMPPAAPGRTGQYLGWQIVKSFMDKHPEMSIQDLIAHKDAQQLLEQARYKPKRK